MRATVIVVGLVAAGGLGAFDAIEAQKAPVVEKISLLTTTISSTVLGANAAIAAAPLSRPQTPRTVVTEIPSTGRLAGRPRRSTQIWAPIDSVHDRIKPSIDCGPAGPCSRIVK
jgi:hypothetical protein